MPSLPWASYFRADHVTLYPSIHSASYFCAVHPLASYFRAESLILHPLASHFHADHLTVHPSIPLASYFSTFHPLGELFSCRLFNSPSFYPFGKLFLITALISFFTLVWRVIFCYEFTSGSCGHLKSCIG